MKHFRDTLAKFMRTEKRLGELKHEEHMTYLQAKDEGLHATERQQEELSGKIDFFKERHKKQAKRCLEAYDRILRIGVEADRPFDRQAMERIAN